MTDRARPPAEILPLDFFTIWAPNAVRGDPDRRKRIDWLDARIQFELAGDAGGTFWLEIGGGDLRGGEGEIREPDLVLRTDVKTWRALNAGETQAPTAVMKGRLRFSGSLFLALKIHFIIG